MPVVEIDVRGLKCAGPVLRMTGALMKKEVNPGDTMAVIADCPSFDKDVREWCQKMKKQLVIVKPNPAGGQRAEIKI